MLEEELKEKQEPDQMNEQEMFEKPQQPAEADEPVFTPADEPAAEEIQPEPQQEAKNPYADSPYTAPKAEPKYQYQYACNPPQQPAAPAKKKGGLWKKLVALVAVACLVAGGWSFYQMSVENQNKTAVLQNRINELEQMVSNPTSEATEATQVTEYVPLATAEGLTPAEVYAQNVDKVVAITCKVQSTSYGRTSEGTSSGSGFILTSDGSIVTNYHVVQNAKQITVALHDGTEYTAQLVGKDSINDVALLKIEAKNLPAVTLGSSEKAAIGDMVVAIGNPLGKLTSTITVGYISGKNRDVTSDKNVISMLQTDAAINPGNSGGPLFNMRGEVIGITTAKYSGTTTSGASIEGIGFAIPIDDVEYVLTDLKEDGHIQSAYLGVMAADTDATYANYYGLPTGAYVQSVMEGGAAEKAGIQPKDTIIGLGDYTITNMSDLTRALRNFRAGDETTITVIRGGQQMELTIVLDERPADLDAETEAEAQTTEETTPSQNGRGNGNSQDDFPNSDSYDDWYNYFKRYFGGTD